MNPLLVALLHRFVRHPAGLVFQLNEATGISGWDDDDRVREVFFQLEIEISNVLLSQIQFIKSFPLLVQIAPNGRYATQKTLY